MTANPLLQHHILPPFNNITPRHIEPAITELTQGNLDALEAQLESLSDVSWQSLVAPLEAREDTLSQAWSPVSHLNGVANNEALRGAYEKCLAKLSAYSTAMGQHEGLYKAYEHLLNGTEFESLTQAKQQAVRNAVRDFKLAGVALPKAKKARYAEIQAELSKLSNQFSNNVLDATQGWYKLITDKPMLAGLPEQAIAAAAEVAKQKSEQGWAFTLDGPVYLTVMTQADNAQLRQALYEGYMTRASDQGPTAGQWDNAQLIEDILTLKQELAVLLGFDHYTELSIAPKMANSSDQVLDFLQKLADQSKPFAQNELHELQVWVKEHYNIETLNAWDVPYYSEKLKQAKFETSQEALRPYFPLPQVKQGLFDLVGQLFNVSIKPDEDVALWHKDAAFYRIYRNDKPIAAFYLDAYAREGKRGGAWMADCRVRRKTVQGIQLPVAFLVCNFNAPVGDAPCLLTHNEVTTLFHEFGHGLHHMLTQVDVAAVSGINGVAWDAVELPSQFLENFCWEPEVLAKISKHYQSGQCLPQEEIKKLLAAKNFQSAMMMVRQLEFSIFDLRLHKEYGNDNFRGVQALLDEVRQQVAVLIPPAFNRFQNGFSHIFAGGYSAGYYSYKWAEVLSADAYAAFEEEGIFNEATGKRFLETVLEQGGSYDAMTIFKQFRGREPSIDALMRHSGLTHEAGSGE